mgnify:CR=1 FL=1
MSFHFCPPSSLFPAESSRNDSHVKFIDQLALRRIAIHDTLLLVINSVGHIYLPVVGIDRKAVVFGVPKLQKRPDGNTVGFHRHSPNIVVDPVKCIPCTVELDFRRPVAQLKLELFLYGESLGVYTIERRCLVTVWAALVTAILMVHILLYLSMTSEVGCMPMVSSSTTLSVSVSIFRMRFWYDQQFT